jgi:hypothetical protein
MCMTSLPLPYSLDALEPHVSTPLSPYDATPSADTASVQCPALGVGPIADLLNHEHAHFLGKAR